MTYRPYYVIEHRWPIHGDRDELIGTRGRLLPMTYRSRELAEKLAGRLYGEACQDGGDDYYEVLRTREDGRYPTRIPQRPFIWSTDEDMPF